MRALTGRGIGTLALALGCAQAPESTPEPGGELVSSLEVEVGRDSVRLALHVTNPADEPVTLEFATGQRYDFAVLTPGGSEIWRWSEGRMFTQVLGTETLGPSETVSYRASWAPAGRSGRFVAVGRLTASNAVVEQRTEFEVPGL